MTVVFAVSDAQSGRITGVLHALLGQSHSRVEIRLVPYGSADRVIKLADPEAHVDRRVVLDRQVAPDLATARNQGAARARGSYLLFIDDRAELPRRSLRRLVAALEASGSAFAAGRMGNASTLGRSVVAPFDPVHQVHRAHTRLSDFPLAAMDLELSTKLFRRSFWVASGLSFVKGLATSQHVALAAYAHAGAFDVLSAVTCVPNTKVSGTPLGQLDHPMEELATWVAQQEETLHLIEELHDGDLRDGWVQGVLEIGIQPFLDDVEWADDEQWALLRGHALALTGDRGEGLWLSLRAESGVKLWLLLHDCRAALEEYVASRWFTQGNRATRVVDGRVHALLPHYGADQPGVPVDCFCMLDSETPLRVVLRKMRWTGPRTIELEMYAYVHFVGLDQRPDVELFLIHDATGARFGASVRQFDHDQINVDVGHRYQDYSRGGMTVMIDATALVEGARRLGFPADGAATWSLEVRMSVGGVRRIGSVSRRDDRGSAALMMSQYRSAREVDGMLVRAVPDEEVGLRIEVSPGSAVTLGDVTVSGRGLQGKLISPVRGLDRIEATCSDGVRVNSKLDVFAGGAVFALDLPPNRAVDRDAPAVTWRLGVHTTDGAEFPIQWTEEGDQWLGIGAGTIVVARSATGFCQVMEAADTMVVDRLEMADGAITVAGRWLGRPPSRVALVLRGRRGTMPVALGNEPQVGTFVGRVSTSCDDWGLGAGPLPSGHYAFDLECGADRHGRVILGPGLVDHLLDVVIDDTHWFRPLRIGREVGVILAVPLGIDESGAFAQNLLQGWCLSGDLAIDDSAVYLQSYAGAGATDSQLAIHHELRRTHPELVLYWGVTDRSARVPEGGVAVLMRSREWYRVLGSARYLVNNMDFDRWYSPRPGQQFLQTFHGYPAKSMGIRLWSAKGFTPRRIEQEIDRTSRDWDLILTPTPGMDRFYREEYRYDGAIHSRGYPRDDVLVSPGAEEIRERTRARLDIGPGQTAVLYAPTWRDDLATNYRSARMVRHLDVESASAQLGSDYVFLMRGHRFHARGSDRSVRTARLLDVTDYPEINDLILAADAAVLDYSSLRFDFALTCRPMVFLVPDLAAYTGGVRGFLYDFPDTAPGPLLETADGVVAALRDLPDLTRRYADAYARFNRGYNNHMDGHAAERVVAEFFGAGVVGDLDARRAQAVTGHEPRLP